MDTSVTGDSAPESVDTLIGREFTYAWNTGSGKHDMIRGKIISIREDGWVEFEVIQSDRGSPTFFSKEKPWSYTYPPGKIHAFPRRTIEDAIEGKYLPFRSTYHIINQLHGRISDTIGND